MINVMVACADYPSENNRAMQFVHVRNKYYKKNGINVTVLNFACKASYVYEGIKVISLEEFYSHKSNYLDNILICHAPNLRNHYRFLCKNRNTFSRFLFFFHGHEIVKINKAYPKPYDYMRGNVIKRIMQDVYDSLKLNVWRRYFLKKDINSPLIFVSNSLKNDFLKYLKLSPKDISKRSCIIHNSVGEIFEKESYRPNKNESRFDFITIRSNLDSSVYCIDLVTEIARQNPSKTFLIIGRGKYFDYNEKPENITLINRALLQEELINYINSSDIALMPTRRDSQGVMTCELATFGIPVITSDLEVCREMFEDFSDVHMFSEKELLEKEIKKFSKKNDGKVMNFFSTNTIKNEIDVINRHS